MNVSQAALDNCGERDAIFAAFHAWQTPTPPGRSPSPKLNLRDPDYKFHLEQTGEKTLSCIRSRKSSWREMRATRPNKSLSPTRTTRRPCNAHCRSTAPEGRHDYPAGRRTNQVPSGRWNAASSSSARENGLPGQCQPQEDRRPRPGAPARYLRASRRSACSFRLTAQPKFTLPDGVDRRKGLNVGKVTRNAP